MGDWWEGCGCQFLNGYEILDGYETLLDLSSGMDLSSWMDEFLNGHGCLKVSADMDMSPPPHPPALSHGRLGEEGPLRTTGGHFLRHQPILSPTEGLLYMPGQGKK